MFLIDTVVLSELRKRERNPHVVTWINAQKSTHLFLSVISIGEIERGITQQRRHNAAFATTLATWLDRLLLLYSDRILPFDLSYSRRWGHLSATLGHDSADLLIAATALEHQLTVVTRNTRHFEPTGVAIINPFVP